MKKIIATLFLATLILAVFASCSAVKFDVEFIVEGGKYHQLTTSGNQVIEMPNDPVKEGYQFKGWYWDEGTWTQPFTANSLLDAPLSKNLRVYAYFVESGGVDGNTTVNVRFNSMGGSAVPMQTVNYGEKVIEPDIPIYDGYYFCGWYTYPDFQTLYSFDQEVKADTTLYAKWSQIGTSTLAVNDFEKVVKANQNTQLYRVFEDTSTGKIYLIYSLGEVKNLILGRVTNQAYYNSGGVTIVWDKTVATESSISESIGISVSASVSKSYSVEVGVEYVVKASASETTTVEFGITGTKEFSKTVSTMKSASQGGNQSLDGFERGRYYDMFLVGNLDVFQCFVFDKNGYTGECFTTTRESSEVSVMALSSADLSFTYENIEQLTPLTSPDFSIVFDSGDGTENAPYAISNPLQLYAVGLNPDANYMLTADIDLSKITSWTPIGRSSSHAFSGTFDGMDKTVKNLSLSYPATSYSQNSYIGLFGYSTGTIKNLKLNNMSLSFDSNHDGNGSLYVSVLCAGGNGTLRDITATKCSLSVHRDNSAYGVIGGRYSGKIENANVSNCSLYGNGDGGCVVGYLDAGGRVNGATADGCTVKYYAVKINRSNGGIVGYANGSAVSNCSVNNIKFRLEGSGSEMHKYNIFGGHYYCPLRPAMGYIIGSCDNVSFDNATCNASNCPIEINDGDKNLVGNTDKNESLNWFRINGGKIGRNN